METKQSTDAFLWKLKSRGAAVMCRIVQDSKIIFKGNLLHFTIYVCA